MASWRVVGYSMTQMYPFSSPVSSMLLPTQFVPSNPKYPSDEGFAMRRTAGLATKSAAECRAYFAEQRKHAVKATYGVSDNYKP
jgi:hypothetical protein